MLKTIPEADLEKIFKGLIRAVKWTRDSGNWEAYKKILNDYTFEGETPYSDADLRAMIGSVSQISENTVELKDNARQMNDMAAQLSEMVNRFVI